MPIESRPPSEELIRMLSKYDPGVGELALQTRDLVLEAAPAAVEMLYEGYALVFWYSLSGRMGDAFCYIGVYTGHVNLGFNRGAELKDTDGHLQGDGKIMRHIKIKDASDLKKRYVRSFVRSAEMNAKAIAASRPSRTAGPRSRGASRSRG